MRHLGPWSGMCHNRLLANNTVGGTKIVAKKIGRAEATKSHTYKKLVYVTFWTVWGSQSSRFAPPPLFPFRVNPPPK